MRYGRVCSENARGHGETYSIDEPMFTISSVGVGGSGAGGGDWYWLPEKEDAVRVGESIKGDGNGKPPDKPSDNGKPPYVIPSMSEIAAVPWNGYNVISTFSGCGGSSLGYRMAGFKVLWASEFVKAAQDTYRANMSEGTVLDTRDIRKVDPDEILETVGLRPGQLDLLDGSPPCASFSTAGVRHNHWGQVRKYSDTKQRTDDLFFEFIRILRGLMPRVFIAENVSGLVKGVAKGTFLEILSALKDSGYRVGCKVLDAQWLGVPQQRKRTIFVGVREDLLDDQGQQILPAHPAPLPYRYSIREAIPWIVGSQAGAFSMEWVSSERPAATVMQSDSTRPHRFQVMARVEPEADMSKYAVGKDSEQLAPGEQSDRYFSLQRAPLDGVSPTVTAEGGNPSCASVMHPVQRRKFSIAELRRICAFPDDFVLTGTYAQQWERLGRAVPPLMMRRIAETIRDQILRRIVCEEEY